MKCLTRHALAVALAAVGVAGTGCQPGGPIARKEASPSLEQQRDAALGGADWRKRIDITVEMYDYGYRPREVRLKSGQPYRLTLVNYGGVGHYFTAPEFFRAVAARKAEVRHQAEVKARDFTSFEVFGRGGSIDFYFVPLVKGTYRVHCHLKDHQPLGIEGTLVIE